MSRYQEIKNYYNTLKDNALLKIIENDLSELESDAINAMTSEIRERKLDEKWIKAIDFALEPMTEEAFALYSNRVVRQHCPLCGQGDKPLTASMIRKVTGQIFRVLRDFKYVLACPSCIFKQMEEAEYYNFRKGWFAIPMGLFETLFAFFYHKHNKKLIIQGQQTKDFTKYLQKSKAKIYYLFF